MFCFSPSREKDDQVAENPGLPLFTVISAKAGIQSFLAFLDSRLRGSDGQMPFLSILLQSQIGSFDMVVLQEEVAGSLQDDTAVFQQVRSIGHLQSTFEILLNKKDGRPSMAQLSYRFENFYYQQRR